MLARFTWTVCVLAASVVGCGGGSGDGTKYVNASGVVMLDGKPIEGATVTFIPKKQGQMSIGLTGADGKFTLKTAAGQSGAAIGDHDVMVTLSVDLTPAVGKASAKPASVDDLAAPTAAELSSGGETVSETQTVKYIVPERYGKPGVLSAKVPDAGLNDHKLDLVSK